MIIWGGAQNDEPPPGITGIVWAVFWFLFGFDALAVWLWVRCWIRG